MNTKQQTKIKPKKSPK